jgi:mannosidase alpha-like ER degradation enhancer 2
MKWMRTAVTILLLAPAAGKAEGNPVLADSVRQEFLHAWNAYKEYAWGHDALKPLSKTPHDWYAVPFLMTPVDAFDTMTLMGLTEEANQAKQLILSELSFDRDVEVQAFEITIRLLGGLLSAYEMDGDRRFLLLAEDLGRRLLPVYGSSTGMPYRYVNLRTGAVRDSINNPAEIGTALLEFGTLGVLTGNREFYEKPKKALVELFNRRSPQGLVGTWINVETGEWVNSSSHIGGAIDSYYEYLLKAWLLFGDEECRRMWEVHRTSLNTHLADTAGGTLWYGRGDMNRGEVTITHFGALEAFFPAVLCLDGDIRRAASLQQSCYRMWNLHGIEPEGIDYAAMKATSKQYVLRPEIIESAYYLYRMTGDTAYVDMAATFFRSIVQWCRTEKGYAYLENVETKHKGDGMESFFFAETLKYFYLVFAPSETLTFDRVIFTTEAHPLKRR